MKRMLWLVCLLFVVCSTWAQEPRFDVDAYKAFLSANAQMSAADLFALHGTEPFKRQVSTHFDDAVYSDSIDLKYSLTSYERALLDRHGFMVTERLAPNSFGDAFMDIYKKDLPVFVSTDAMLHALHMSYDLILQETELGVLIPRLGSLLDGLHAALPALATRYSTEPGMLRSLHDLDVYLTVPRVLLTGQAVAPVWRENQATVDELLRLIEGEQAMAVALFAEACRVVDFSQFTPRSHYTQNERLTRYFQAMIWLGRTELYLIAPNTDRCRPSDADVQRQTIDAVLLAEAATLSNADGLLQEIDDMIRFFVGESDNVTLGHLHTLMTAAQLTQASDLLDVGKWHAFQDVLAEQSFASQRINSQILFSNDISDPDRIQPASAFMLLGQRFVIDSYVAGHVVFDEVVPAPGASPRMLPSTQDVLFALGNDASAQLLEEELDRYGYAPQLAALRYLVDSYEPDFWNSTLYNGWLDAIRTLNPPAERSQLPGFMQTAAWWQQKMNTQLAAWAQLRHDNLLYAKQSYSGGITCFYPYSYVEPIPAFFEAVSRFARQATRQFETTATHIADYFRFMEAVNDTLGVIAQKELDATPLEEGELDFLRRMLREENICGPQIDGWYPNLFYGGTDNALKPDLVVADIHTAPTDEFGNMVGWVLHAGTGPLNMAVVTAEVPGEGLISFIGPVLSYYEHLSTGFERLTDEVWQTAYVAAPSFRPDFVNLYLADPQGISRGAAFSLATGIEEEEPGVPRAIQLVQNYPNPFNEYTVIGFSVSPREAYQRVTLDVYDIQGRRIRRLLSDRLPPGHYTVRWDGLMESGGRAASGVYFSRLALGDRHASGTMTLVR
ncbi:MAG: DUF3160 domain-containing protein [Rhodothermales bacterium]